jgi:hypothetical protein
LFNKKTITPGGIAFYYDAPKEGIAAWAQKHEDIHDKLVNISFGGQGNTKDEAVGTWAPSVPTASKRLHTLPLGTWTSHGRIVINLPVLEANENRFSFDFDTILMDQK